MLTWYFSETFSFLLKLKKPLLDLELLIITTHFPFTGAALFNHPVLLAKRKGPPIQTDGDDALGGFPRSSLWGENSWLSGSLRRDQEKS